MSNELQKFISLSREALNELHIDHASNESGSVDMTVLCSALEVINPIHISSLVHSLPDLARLTELGSNLLEHAISGRIEFTEEVSIQVCELVATMLGHLDAIEYDDPDEVRDEELRARIDSTIRRVPAASSIAGSDNAVSVVAATSTASASASASASNSISTDANADATANVAAAADVLEMDEDMKELMKDFMQESCENLDRVDSELIELEEKPGDRQLLSSIFRTIHTIKGTCGFLGFEKLEQVTHEGENLLVKLRDGELVMNEDIATGLMAMVDTVRLLLQVIADTGTDGNKGDASLVQRLRELNETGNTPDADSHNPQINSNKNTEAAPLQSADPIQDTVSVTSEQESENSTRVSPFGAHQDVPPMDVVREKAPRMTTVEASIRVEVPVLDSLMDLVGELVLARNQIVEYVGQNESTEVVAAAQRLNVITSDCLLYTSPSPRDLSTSRMPSSA